MCPASTRTPPLPCPLRTVADRTLELLDAVEHVITRDYLTDRENAPTAAQEAALVKARLFLIHLVSQLDRAVGGGVPRTRTSRR